MKQKKVNKHDNNEMRGDENTHGKGKWVKISYTS